MTRDYDSNVATRDSEKNLARTHPAITPCLTGSLVPYNIWEGELESQD
jgi:hypothetical protein